MKQQFVVGIAADTAAAKSLQSCPTLCDPRDGSPPVSPVPGILQARTLEWAIGMQFYLRKMGPNLKIITLRENKSYG